ncbi:11503_t:CDS:1, partial [Scutellospora calospora]
VSDNININNADVENMKIDTVIENTQMDSEMLRFHTNHEGLNVNEKRLYEDDVSVEKEIKKIRQK